MKKKEPRKPRRHRHRLRWGLRQCETDSDRVALLTVLAWSVATIAASIAAMAVWG